VQELLPGTQAPNPSDKLISQLVALNDRQAGTAVAGTDNWNAQVSPVVHNDSNGFRFRIGTRSPEGAEFVARLQSFANQEGSFVPADKIRSISGPAALNTYMSYWIMQVTDFGSMFCFRWNRRN